MTRTERNKVKILGQIKKISVFQVMGLNNLGSEGTYIFLQFFSIFEKYISLCILKGNLFEVSPVSLGRVGVP